MRRLGGNDRRDGRLLECVDEESDGSSRPREFDPAGAVSIRERNVSEVGAVQR